MRYPKWLVLAFLTGTLAHAQNKQLLYDFKEVPQALMLNPGMETSYQWYAGIPLLSGISVTAGSSGFSVNDLFADDGLNFTQKVRDRLVYGLGIRDEVSSTYRLELLNGGFRARNKPKDFYSFGIYHEGDVILYWPRDLAILGFEGNANSLDRRFRLNHLKTRGEFLNVIHFGLNREISESLTIGARAKIYSGILDFNSVRNRGYFVTTQGQNNLLAHTLESDMQLRTSGLEELIDALDDEGSGTGQDIRDIFLRRGFFGGDLGLGLDVGFSYNLNNKTLITASLLDLGFLYHSTDPSNYRLQGRATTEGVEVILPDALADPSADFWQDLVDDIEALIPFVEDTKSYITFRPTQLYGSVRHNFGQTQPSLEECECEDVMENPGAGLEYKNSVGGQLYMINRPRGPQMALTAFYQRRFGHVLSIKGTYTVDKFSATNLGMGLSMQTGPLNVYLMADNLLALTNVPAARRASLQFGLNIISWGRNLR